MKFRSQECWQRWTSAPALPAQCSRNAYLPGVLLGTVLSQSCNQEKEHETSRSYLGLYIHFSCKASIESLYSILIQCLLHCKFVCIYTENQSCFLQVFTTNLSSRSPTHSDCSSKSSYFHHSLRFHLFEWDGSIYYNISPNVRVAGINQLNVLSQGLPPEENQVLELGTGSKRAGEEHGSLQGSTDPPGTFHLAKCHFWQKLHQYWQKGEKRLFHKMKVLRYTPGYRYSIPYYPKHSPKLLMCTEIYII